MPDPQRRRVVFYSWQSDHPNATNRGLFEQALEKATADVRADASIAVEPVVDRDTQGVPGTPDISGTILQKIDDADIFVGDVSIVTPPGAGRPCPNPNVLLELGYAIARLGWDRILMVQNVAFGDPSNLPFDLRGRRVITYRSLLDDPERAPARRELQVILTAV